MINFAFWTVFGLFILLSVFLVLLVLVQKGKGGGIMSALGGGGANSAFGYKLPDVLMWTTSVAFGAFVVLAVTLNLLANAK